MAGASPWVITGPERAQHDAQFLASGAVGGFLSGDRARDLFMKSGLPPPVLGHIWGLADLNKDGRMDAKEFSIAMHLIQNQMKGVQVPPVLPESLRMEPMAAMPMGLPVVPTPVMGGPPGRPPPMTASPVRPPSAQGHTLEMPQGSKLKYSQMFNNLDKGRVGVLSGVHARNVLSQSQLPNPVLAQIWGLSDLDKDGRLSSDEFCLAMHFVDLVKAGVALPATVPAVLIPPTVRARTLSQGESQPGIPGPMAPGGGVVDVEGAPQAASMMAASFEDRRRQNFDKGQAELERRRALLEDQERREREERERKEREAQAQRDALAQEQERRRQLEQEKTAARQRELQMQREAEQRAAMEQREAARRELERQRALEAEKQRLSQLLRLRQSEQEALCSAKQKHKNLTFQLQALGEKSGEMNQQITDMRERIVAITSGIEGMKGQRDAKMGEMAALNQDIGEKQQRMATIGAEKYQVMSAKREQAGSTDPIAASLNQVSQAVLNKTANMARLRQALQDVQVELDQKKSVAEERKAYLAKVQAQLTDLTSENREVYNQVLAKQKEAREALEAHRGAGGAVATTQPAPVAGEDPWGSGAADPAAAGFGDSFAADFGASGDWASQATPTGTTPAPDSGNTTRYRALYEFVGRSEDELSFQPGDTILVFKEHGPMEPGWLAGQIKDKVGWFPESFAQVMGEGEEGAQEATPHPPPAKLPSIDEEGSGGQTAVPSSTSVHSVTSALSGGPAQAPPEDEVAQALYAWKAKKDTHITFAKGDQIKILEKQEMWWKGELVTDPSVKGFFPKSYVKLVSGGGGGAKSGSRSQTPGSEAEAPKTPDEEAAAGGALGGAPIPTSGTVYVAMYAFAAAETGDLGFEIGDRILVTKQDGDWWAGTVGDRSGIFPSSYVATEAEAAAAAAEPAAVQEAAPAVQAAAAPPSAPVEVGKVIAPFQGTTANQLTLSPGDLIRIRTKSPTGWWEGELQKKGQEKKLGWFPGNYVKLMGGAGSLPGSETTSIASAGAEVAAVMGGGLGEGEAEALYDYAAQQEDELSFRQGDRIRVLEKVDGEWWKGQGPDGAHGIFPAAYVREGAGGRREVELRSSEPAQLRSSESAAKLEAAKRELYSTEKNFIADMQMVVSVFRRPLRKAGVLSREEASVLLGDWEGMVGVAQAFLSDLRGPSGEWRVAAAVLEHRGAMDAYGRFCRAQSRSLELLKEKEARQPDFRAVYARCCQSEGARGLPLSHFLLLPITRVTKYPLLLHAMAKYEGDPAERAALEGAEAALRELCASVNAQVCEVENLQMLHWCQEHVATAPTLQPPLLFGSPTNRLGPRSLLHSGLLHKAKSGRPLLGLLFNDLLLLAAPDQPLHGDELKLEPHLQASFSLYKAPLLLAQTSLVLTSESTGSSSDGAARTFALETATDEGPLTLALKASTPNARTLWFNKLNTAIKEAKAVQPTQSGRGGSGSLGRLLVEVVCVRGLEEGGVGRWLSAELSLGEEKESRRLDLQSKDSLLSTQLLIASKEDTFRLSLWEPRLYSPDVPVGRVGLPLAGLLQRSAAHRGPMLQQLPLEDSHLPQPSVILKLVLHMLSNNF